MLCDIWGEALEYFLRDSSLSNEEQAYLASLAKAFGLSQAELVGVRRETGGSAYGRAVERVLADGQVSDEEWAGLESLKSAIALPDGVHEAIFGEKAKNTYQKALSEVIADRRVSPIEQKHLAALAKSLHIDVTLDGELQAKLDAFASYWRVENGDIPTIDVPINLQKGERAYWKGQVEWHELRTRTTRIGYSGPTLSIPIVKGLRWRVGSFAPHRMTREELTRIDSGILYVTSKRIIFDGSLKNNSLRYSSILSFQVFSDGIAVDKASGRSPYFLFQGDPEPLAVILGAALSMSGGE
jgi:hypothetical protein